MTQEAKTLLDRIEALAPQIAERSREIEAIRNLPGDIVSALRDAGLFRMFAPKHYGGMELDLPTGVDVLRRLARVDSAVGWTATISSGSAIAAPLLPRPTLDEIYRQPDVVMAGSTQPTARAERVPRGWRAGGRWPFVSGCRHADWIAGFCIMHENERPLPDPHATDGRPLIMGFVLPASAWEIEDSWHAAGLGGTGSHHIVLKERIVSAANFLDLAHGTPCEHGPLYRAPWHMLVLLPPVVAVGIAEGALDALVQVAKTGRRQLRAATAMQDSEVFRYELGRAAAEIRTARLALEAQVKLHWAHACADSLRNDARFIEGLQVGLQVAETCRRATEACYLLGGAGAVYLDSPLQQRLRDIMVVSQHYVMQARQYTGVGAALLAEGDARSPAPEPVAVPPEDPKAEDPKVARLRA